MEENNVEVIETKQTLKEKLASKKKEIGEKVKEKTKKTLEWCRDNKDAAKAIVTISAALIGGTAKIACSKIKENKVREERNMRELYCYDRSLGHYWKLSHPLSTREWRVINERKKNGEKLGDILWDLGALE